MFDIGFVELLIIGIVALVVLGPQRLPKAARFAGYWVRRARAQWFSVKAEFEREIEADEMRNSIQKPFEQLKQDLQESADEMNSQARSLQDDLQDSADDLNSQARSLQNDMQADADSLNSEAQSVQDELQFPEDDVHHRIGKTDRHHS